MSNIIVYTHGASAAEAVRVIDRIPGVFKSGVKGLDGSQVWEDGDKLYCGELSVSDGLFYLTEYDNSDGKLNPLELICVCPAQIATAIKALQDKSLALDDIKKEKEREKQEFDDVCTTLKRKISTLERTNKNNADKVKKLREEMQSIPIAVALPKPKDVQRANCQALINLFVNSIVKDLKDYLSPPPAPGGSSSSAAAAPNLQWKVESQNGVFTPSTCQLFKDACEAVNADHTLVKQFVMNGYAYEMFFDDASNCIMQRNMETKTTRRVEQSAVSQAPPETEKMKALASMEFRVSFSNNEIMGFLQTYSFEEGTFQINHCHKEFASTHKSIVELGNILADYSGMTFSMDPKKCVVLVKKTYMKMVLTMIKRYGDRVYIRPVLHGTDEKAIKSVAESDFGLESYRCNSGSNYGYGTYVATTYHASEQMYNKTSRRGKAILLILFSPDQKLQETDCNTRSIYAYNLYCNKRDENGDLYKNAIVVREDTFLLPIAILSS